MLNIDGYQTEFFKNLPNFSSKKLCEIVITARYIGSLDQESILCMQELAKRRDLGEQFDYESFIENTSKKLPNFRFDLKKKIQISGFGLESLKGIK